MKNKELLEEIIESKKIKSANRKPRYATRKLSIGLVSCLLGFITFVGGPHGKVVYAAESVAPTTVEEPASTGTVENDKNLTEGGVQELR